VPSEEIDENRKIMKIPEPTIIIIGKIAQFSS
jgi:hypothetical protein